ncbi:hypothetical protein TNCV_788111 [Trichonephila clavipes]|nr:hypothetical protein TNCV_3494791 [Trichonephila clavipes]GFT59799.1 hypothetical protein TNCV_2496341 [Trichonephila clavipes]GFT71885.1 hypothetical protein TNCV_2346981 [Trichonephila clavipes]GFU63033.1 hypothetical protein TNCV_788111 [Trichonephila clavipes]
MGNGRRRAAPIPRMKGENSRNRMRENVSNQENSPAERGGRTCPETRPLYRSRAPAGEGKNAGRQSGRLKAVNQGSDQARQEPSIKDAVQGSEGSVVNRV